MRNYDLSPLYRSTVGFDRLFAMLDQVSNPEAGAYPPYNIERTGETAYRVSIAVAGFTPRDIAIEVRENTLSVRGERQADAGDRKAELLYQGIAARTFERRFQLAEHVQVTGATMENGLLHIDLVREIPEAKKPRLIPIGGTAPTVIETARAA